MDDEGSDDEIQELFMDDDIVFDDEEIVEATQDSLQEETQDIFQDISWDDDTLFEDDMISYELEEAVAGSS